LLKSLRNYRQKPSRIFKEPKRSFRAFWTIARHLHDQKNTKQPRLRFMAAKERRERKRKLLNQKTEIHAEAQNRRVIQMPKDWPLPVSSPFVAR
jgi:hypothetical protein